MSSGQAETRSTFSPPSIQRAASLYERVACEAYGSPVASSVRIETKTLGS
jgi:hypothetical protein